MRVEVRAGSRYHFGLVDLTQATPRAFGGLGAILDGPAVHVIAGESSKWIVTGLDDDGGLRERIIAVMREFQTLTGWGFAELNVTHALSRHHGLGSGTATILSCLVAANELSRSGLPDEELVRLSGRGGASGTGVNGYWQGGWIVDCGQEPVEDPLPSGASAPLRPSMMLQRIPPPPWSVDLYFPPKGVRVSGLAEAAIFREASNGPREEALHALALLHHGLVPSLLSQDLLEFGRFMTAYQRIGLKRYEIANQHSSVRDLMDEMRSLYPCVAMSSMGPTVAGIRDIASPIPDLGLPGCPRIITSVDSRGVQVKWLA